MSIKALGENNLANSLQNTLTAMKGAVECFDAIVVGAGVSGLYQLYRLRALELAEAAKGYEGGVLQ